MNILRALSFKMRLRSSDALLMPLSCTSRCATKGDSIKVEAEEEEGEGDDEAEEHNEQYPGPPNRERDILESTEGDSIILCLNLFRSRQRLKASDASEGKHCPEEGI